MADSGTYDPDTLIRRQKIADQLLMQATKPREIRHWAQGLGQMGEAAIAGLMSGMDDKERREGTKAQADAIAAILGGSGGGQSPTGPMAGGAGPAPAPSPMPSAPPVAGPVASLPPPPPPIATPRREVAPSPKVWGDREAEAAGLYEPSKPAAFADRFAGAGVPGVPGVAAALGGGPKPVQTERIPPTAALQPAAGAPPEAAPLPPPTHVAQNAPAAAAGPMAASPMAEKVAKMLNDPNPYVRKTGMALGQNLITKQLEGDKPTDEMREYQLYRQQGGKDSFFEYKSGLKKAGAQNIAVNNTVNPIVKGVGDRFNETMDAGQAAIPQIQGIHEARKALDQGTFTGVGADPKLMLAKVGNLFGLTNDQAANTEVARSAIGNSVLAKAKTLGANPSNTDREYIEKVVGGQIQLEEKSIRRLLDMQEKWARDSIRRANDMGGKLIKAQPKELENIAPLLSITEPGTYDDFMKANPIAPPQTVAPPAGAPKIRTFNPATRKFE